MNKNGNLTLLVIFKDFDFEFFHPSYPLWTTLMSRNGERKKNKILQTFGDSQRASMANSAQVAMMAISKYIVGLFLSQLLDMGVDQIKNIFFKRHEK